MNQSRTVPFLIVGGGIGGLATALALARKGYPAHVLEREPTFGELGAGIQLAPNATGVLDRLGVMDEVAACAVFPRRLVLADALSGQRLTSLDLGEAFLGRYGHPYLVMHRGDLLSILLAACRSSDLVTLETDKDVVAVEEHGDRVRAQCADGSAYEAGALVGADGLGSRIRPLISRDEPVCAQFVAYRGTVPTREMPHHAGLDNVVMWIGPDLHFVQYPLRRGELYNQVAVFRSHRYTPDSEEWGTEEELEEHFAVTCEHVRAALAAIRRDRRWAMYDRLPIDTWTRGRVTLLGDAAHPMLQYIAQGACQALEDARSLAEAVAGHGGEVERAFAAYSSARAPRAARVQRTARLWGEICHADGLTAALRNALFSRRAEDDYTDVDWLYGHRG